MMPTIRELADAVITLVTAGAPLVDLYPDGVGVNTVPRLDPDGAVHQYAAFYWGSGQRVSGNLTGVVDATDWSFQVTCTGGDPTRAMACVDAITNALTGQRLPVPGAPSTGLLVETGGSGDVREDRDARPSRWWVAITYQILAPT